MKLWALRLVTSAVLCSSVGACSSSGAGPAPESDAGGTADAAASNADSSGGPTTDAPTSDSQPRDTAAGEGSTPATDGAGDAFSGLTSDASALGAQDATMPDGSRDALDGTFDSSVDSRLDGPLDAPSHGGDADGGEGGGTDGGGGGSIFSLCGLKQVSFAPNGGSRTLLSNVGHQAAVTGIWRSGDRILSAADGWILWDASEEEIAGSLTGTPVALAGSVFLVLGEGLEIHSLADGSIMATIPIGSWAQFGLATDGSYVWTASSSAIATWSTGGSALFTQAGSFSNANVFAGPSALQVATTGTNVVQTMATATGQWMTSQAYNGTLAAWFTDGSHFLSAVGNDVSVYTPDGVRSALVAMTSVGTLGGVGNYYYVFGQGLTLFAIGSSAPVGFYAANAKSIAALPGSNVVALFSPGQVEELQIGQTVTATTIPAPTLAAATQIAFAPDAPALLAGGDPNGLVYFVGTAQSHSTTGTFGCGKVGSMQGSSAGKLAVVAAANHLLYFDVPTATFEQDFDVAPSKVLLSADGLTLVSAYPSHVDTYDILDGGLATLVTYLCQGEVSDNCLDDVSLAINLPSRVGTLGDQASSGPMGFSVGVLGGPQSVDVAAHPAYDSVLNSWKALLPPAISPSGAKIAITQLAFSSGATTEIDVGGTLNGAVDGTAIGWADESHLVIEILDVDAESPSYTLEVCDDTGALTGAPAIAAPTPPPPSLYGYFGPPIFDPVSSTRIFWRANSTIYDIAAGAVVDATGLPPGTMAGPYVAAVVGHALVATPQ